MANRPKSAHILSSMPEADSQQPWVSTPLANEQTGERKKFKPFKAFRRMFRDGKRGGKKKHASKDAHEPFSDEESSGRQDNELPETGNWPISMSLDNLFTVDESQKQKKHLQSAPKPIPAKRFPNENNNWEIPSPQDDWHSRRAGIRSMFIEKPSLYLSTSAPSIGLGENAERSDSAARSDETKENKPKTKGPFVLKSKTKESMTHKDKIEPKPDMAEETPDSNLNKTAAYDRIAARPRNRRGISRPPRVAKASIADEFDIACSIFPSYDAIEDIKKADALVEPPSPVLVLDAVEEKDESTKTTEKFKNESSNEGITFTKKTLPLKSPFGVAVISSLDDVANVKLRKTNSPSSPKSPPLLDAQSPTKKLNEDLKKSPKVSRKPAKSPELKTKNTPVTPKKTKKEKDVKKLKQSTTESTDDSSFKSSKASKDIQKKIATNKSIQEGPGPQEVKSKSDSPEASKKMKKEKDSKKSKSLNVESADDGSHKLSKSSKDLHKKGAKNKLNQEREELTLESQEIKSKINSPETPKKIKKDKDSKKLKPLSIDLTDNSSLMTSKSTKDTKKTEAENKQGYEEEAELSQELKPTKDSPETSKKVKKEQGIENSKSLSAESTDDGFVKPSKLSKVVQKKATKDKLSQQEEGCLDDKKSSKEKPKSSWFSKSKENVKTKQESKFVKEKFRSTKLIDALDFSKDQLKNDGNIVERDSLEDSAVSLQKAVFNEGLEKANRTRGDANENGKKKGNLLSKSPEHKTGMEPTEIGQDASTLETSVKLKKAALVPPKKLKTAENKHSGETDHLSLDEKFQSDDKVRTKSDHEDQTHVKVTVSSPKGDEKSAGNMFLKLRKVGRSNSANEDKDDNTETSENIFVKLKKVDRSNSGKENKQENEEKSNENPFAKLRRVKLSASDIEKDKTVESNDINQPNIKLEKVTCSESTKENKASKSKVNKFGNPEAIANNNNKSGIQPSPSKAFNNAKETTVLKIVVSESLIDQTQHCDSTSDLKPGIRSNDDVFENKSDGNPEKSSIFPVKLRSVGQNDEFYSKDNKPKSPVKSKPKNQPFKKTNINNVIESSSNANNNNSHDISLSSIKLPITPKPQFKPKPSITHSVPRENHSNISNSTVDLQASRSANDVVLSCTKDGGKEAKEDLSAPGWVKLARKRSKTWVSSVTTGISNDSNANASTKTHESESALVANNDARNRLKQDSDDLVKHSSVKNMSVLSGEHDENEKFPKIQYKSKSFEEKIQLPRNVATRSISATASHSKPVISGVQVSSVKNPLSPDISTSGDAPPWLAIAAKKSKRWTREETV